MRFLGLDASSSVIGIAVLDFIDNKIEVIKIDHFKCPKKGDLFNKLNIIREFIFKIIDQYKPDRIILEDIILFMAGKSTAKTITTLAVLNRTVGLAIFNKTGKSPELFNVMAVRHALKEGKQLPAKETIPALLEKVFDKPFPMVYTKTGKLDKISYDRADAAALAYTAIKKLKK